MIGQIVLPSGPSAGEEKIETGPQSFLLAQRMDPLSEVLAQFKPRAFVSGGFAVRGDLAVQFPRHQGIKCYAMLAGECWLVVEGVAEPLLLKAGDCLLLPRGFPFQMSTNLSLPPVDFFTAREQLMSCNDQDGGPGGCYLAGGHFALTGAPAEMILQSLPPVVHIRRESDKEAMRWSLERMRDELREARPGSSLIAQQLAYTMLIQALRLHLADADKTGRGWLAALADEHLSVAIKSMHDKPGHRWTVESLAERVGMSRSVFALRFRDKVGASPMEYLTRWRMLLAADRLRNSSEGLSTISQSLGYESESAFGKAFRRVMGCSARRYGRSAGAIAVEGYAPAGSLQGFPTAGGRPRGR